jgi:hypothetical protein
MEVMLSRCKDDFAQIDRDSGSIVYGIGSFGCGYLPLEWASRLKGGVHTIETRGLF